MCLDKSFSIGNIHSQFIFHDEREIVKFLSNNFLSPETSSTEWSEWGEWTVCDATCNPSADGSRTRMRVSGANHESQSETCSAQCQRNSVLLRTLDEGGCGQAHQSWTEWAATSQAKIENSS